MKETITIKDLVGKNACAEGIKWTVNNFVSFNTGIDYKTFYDEVKKHNPSWIQWLDDIFGKIETTKYKLGSIFEYDKEYYVLARFLVGSEWLMSITKLSNDRSIVSVGNSYGGSIQSKDCAIITQEEFDKISGNAIGQFVYLPNATIEIKSNN